MLLRDNDVHVACIQETYLSSNVRVHIDNFNIYRNDRLTHGGGVAIAVRKNLSHRLLPIATTNIIENISVEIQLGQKMITITSAYNPQPSTHFANDFNILTNQCNEALLFGDYNAKHTAWNCVTCDATGKTLHDLIDGSEFILYAPDSPTHYPHAGSTPSTIDLLISNTTLPIMNFWTIDRHISDHCPVLCQIKIKHSQVITNSYRYDLADWNKYRALITRENFIPSSGTTDEIDQSIESFTATIKRARDKTVPKSIHREKLFRIAPDTLNAIKYKYKLSRLWKKCTDATMKTAYKTAVNISAKMVRDLVARDRNARWTEFVNQMDGSAKKLWRVSRSLRGKRGTTPTVLWHEDNKLITNGEKANALATIFERAHGITTGNVHPHDAVIEHFTGRFRRRGPYTNFPSIELNEILHALSTLRPLKAPGVDDIPNILLKNLPMGSIESIREIFNACIMLNYWPSSFKVAKVIPIPKPGKDCGKSTNYRPISLLNTLGKLFEKIINVRLMAFAEEHSIINGEQFGFRPQHSTSHQILRVTRHIRRNWALRKSTGMVLFDIEKAFDSVWHDGLVYKLKKFGFPDYLCAMIREFTANRSFRVHVLDDQSDPRQIPAGVPQGSILSPGLYSIYVSDLRVDPKSETACYADDTAVYASANQTGAICRRLQKSLIRIENFFDKWKIKINPTKTQAVIFPYDGRRRRNPTTQLTLNGIQIPFANSAKYLGVTLDRRLRFGPHIGEIRTKATKCMAALYPLIGRRSFLSVKNKLLIYRAVIRPVLTYASPIWCTSAVSNRKQLQVIQNKCLKMIFRLPWRMSTTAVHERANIPTIADFVQNLNDKFSNRCILSDYNLIRELAN